MDAVRRAAAAQYQQHCPALDCGGFRLDQLASSSVQLTNQKGGCVYALASWFAIGDDIVKALCSLASGLVAVASAALGVQAHMPRVHSVVVWRVGGLAEVSKGRGMLRALLADAF